ncbi:MAG: methyl-accepting chemotaxis protein [Stenotrophomonas sp.]
MKLHRLWTGYINNISVRRKLNLLTALIALGVIALAVVAARIQYLDLYDTRLATVHAHTEAGNSVLEHYAALVDNGQLSLEQAQAQAIQTLANLRAPSSGMYYTLLDTRDDTMVMHPFRRERAGTALADYTDEAGVQYNSLLAAAARSGGGEVVYLSRQSKDEPPVDRIAYAMPFAPWGWATSTGAYVKDVQQQAMSFTLVMAVSGGLMVLLVFALSWFIGSNIINPLRRATGVAERIADGLLDNDTSTAAADEPGQLLRSMGRMQQQLHGVIQATGQLCIEHQAGTVSARIDTAGMPGEYGLMAQQVNTLAERHVHTAELIAGLAGDYAVGNLEADPPALPGEQAALTSAMREVKTNLQAISAEITRLSRAAAAGDFSVRGDSARFRFGFAAMVEQLNQLMAGTGDSLQDISRLLQAIAAGDLTTRISGDHHGVFARMRDDANHTASNLTGIIGGIQQASLNIEQAASEISSANADLSRRTEQQAANLEETAASMEELTSTVQQNAESARLANELSIGAQQVASQGGQVVDQVVDTMARIETASRRIVDIIAVIDGIAFQTNILALNAAVEAARAGEQGRGFAVVAGEVRLLAQRSASAAREVKQLIQGSVDQVADGSARARQAGTTMSQIIASVERVTAIMADIADASREQGSGIEQVNQTVIQMDRTTQQNAALVEEAAAAANAMQQQAIALNAAVAVFRTQPGHTPAIA